jgi:hypothetical protein
MWVECFTANRSWHEFCLSAEAVQAPLPIALPDEMRGVAVSHQPLSLLQAPGLTGQ